MAKPGLRSELTELGLNETEAEVYLELLRKSDVLASSLASRVSSSRTHVYDTLDSLMKKALVSYVVRGGRRYYNAAEPARLIDYITYKETELEQQKERISLILPKLIAIETPSEGIKVEVLEGRAGYKAILREIVDTGKEFELLNSSEELNGKFEIPLQQFYRDRKERGIKARVICQIGSRPLKSSLDKVRFVQLGAAKPMPTYIYGDIVAIVLNLEELLIIKVRSAAFAEGQRKEFEVMWNQDVQVMHGLDGIQFCFEDMLKAGHCDWIGARGYFFEKRKEYVSEWAKRAMASGFTLRNLVDPEVKGTPVTKLPFAQTKYVLKREFFMLSVFWVYGGKVVISNWAEEEPITFIIENKNLYETYKQQFELLWATAKP